MSNYATKSDLEKAKCVDTSKFAKEADLASLKVDVNELDIDKLKTVAVDLSKLSNVVKSDAVKKNCVLVTKFNAIDTSGFVLNNQYGTVKSAHEKEN